MSRFVFIIGIVALLFIVSSCNAANDIDQTEIDVYQVKQTSDKIEIDDFIFRLVSEKEEYAAGEEVQLYGELIYIGEKEEISIAHGDSGINFAMEEKIRAYHIDDIIKDIGVMREMRRYDHYRVNYAKNTFYLEGKDENYNIFMKQFLNEEGFPPGYYVVKGTADFGYNAGNHDEEMESVKLELEIDFKVNTK